MQVDIVSTTQSTREQTDVSSVWVQVYACQRNRIVEKPVEEKANTECV